jgi:DMSO/TMAO reductase YedYZ molybdopterin-dependent catalytic subunit
MVTGRYRIVEERHESQPDGRRRFLARTLGAIGNARARRLREAVPQRVVPQGARRGRGGKLDGRPCGDVPPVDGAGISEADRSPTFRSNGTAEPDSDAYREIAANAFASYRLVVDGLVEAPARLTLADLRALPSRTQITRHDCVEGWSAIAKWKGARLGALLESVRLKPDARFAVFHCADPMAEDGTDLYYESIDLEDAFHPQTILAYEMNDAALPIANGAPIRLRVERQLGYKHAKYVMRIELVQSFAHITGGKGGLLGRPGLSMVRRYLSGR